MSISTLPNRPSRARLAFVLALFSSTLAAGPHPARAATWTAIGPDGGPASHLLAAATDPRTLYVTTWSGSESSTAIFRTTDGGGSWRSLPQPPPSFKVQGIVAIEPADPRHVIAVGRVGAAVDLLASDDAGSTWRRASAGLPTDDLGQTIVASVAFDPAAAGRLLAATPTGLYESVDGARSWHAQSLRLRNLAKVAFGPAGSGSVWALEPRGGESEPPLVLGSLNGGRTFRAIPWPGEIGYDFLDLTPDPRDPRRVLAWTRFGIRRWESGGWRALARPGQTLYDLEVQGDGRLVAAIGRELAESVDGGKHWRALPGSRVATLVEVETGPDGRVLATSVEGVWRSEPRGGNLRLAVRGITAQILRAIAAGPGGTSWAAGQELGLKRSRNGGRTWQAVAREIGLDDSGTRFVADIRHAQVDPRRVYVTFSVLTPRGSELRLGRSDDGGDHWRLVPVPEPLRRAASPRLEIDPSDPDVLYLAGAGVSSPPLHGLLEVSHDGGETWRPLALPSAAILERLVVSPANSRRLIALTFAGTLHSRDGGETWIDLDDGLPSDIVLGQAVAFDPEEPRTVWVAGATRLYRSLDGGDSFAAVGPALRGSGQRNLAIVAGGRIALGTPNRVVEIFDPTDGSLRPAGTGLSPYDFFSGFAVDPTDRGNLYAAALGRSLFRLELED